jgi:hypothetical protein
MCEEHTLEKITSLAAATHIFIFFKYTHTHTTNTPRPKRFIPIGSASFAPKKKPKILSTGSSEKSTASFSFGSSSDFSGSFGLRKSNINRVVVVAVALVVDLDGCIIGRCTNAWPRFMVTTMHAKAVIHLLEQVLVVADDFIMVNSAKEPELKSGKPQSTKTLYQQ